MADDFAELPLGDQLAGDDPAFNVIAGSPAFDVSANSLDSLDVKAKGSSGMARTMKVSTLSFVSGSVAYSIAMGVSIQHFSLPLRE